MEHGKLHPVHFSHVQALDGIRGVAILMVMLFHFIGWHDEPGWVRKCAVAGQTGVDLFFVLSGYLITQILVRTRDSPNYFKAFYGRRILRIFPLYYLFLILHFLVMPWMEGGVIAPLSQQIWSLLFLENIPATFGSIPTAGSLHYWSLAVEEHFYLLWPWIVLRTKRESLWKVLACILALTPCLRMVLLSFDVGVYYFTPTRMDALAWGGLLAVSSADNGIRLFRRPLLGACLVATCLAPLFLFYSGEGKAWIQASKLTLIPLFYAFMIAAVSWHPALRRFFERSILTFSGRISFGLYMFHGTIFIKLHPRWETSHFFRDIAIAFGCSFIVAVISFRWFESFFLSLKHRFPYNEPTNIHPRR